MTNDIDHDELRQMRAEGALLLDVRDRAGYAAEHLPGATSLPLKTLDRETTAHLDRERPLITYCWEWT